MNEWIKSDFFCSEWGVRKGRDSMVILSKYAMMLEFFKKRLKALKFYGIVVKMLLGRGFFLKGWKMKNNGRKYSKKFKRFFEKFKKFFKKFKKFFKKFKIIFFSHLNIFSAP